MYYPLWLLSVRNVRVAREQVMCTIEKQQCGSSPGVGSLLRLKVDVSWCYIQLKLDEALRSTSNMAHLQSWQVYAKKLAPLQKDLSMRLLE